MDAARLARHEDAAELQGTRFACIALIVVFTAIVIAFNIQNLETVTVSLTSMSTTMPVSVLVLLIYVPGMLTGAA